MNEQEKQEFFDELSGLSLADLLRRYAENPEERPYIEEFFLGTFSKQPYLKFKESLYDIPFGQTEEQRAKIKRVRSYALSIISRLMEFDDINSLDDLRTKVEHELKVAEGYEKPILPEGGWRDSDNSTPKMDGIKEKVTRVLKKI